MLAEVKQQVIGVFEPLPWQVDPWRDLSPVLLLTGSAGGGKSRLAAEKVHAFCLRYSGATGLIVRKARSSMTNSTLVFYDRVIVAGDPRVVHRTSLNRFEYKNGSMVAYGGMFDDSQREQVRGVGSDGGVDMVWMEEADQFEERDFNELLGRNRGKAGGFRQIILTNNPNSPLHWIYRRMIKGDEASVYYSRAADNPHNPPDYQDKLGAMTGLDGYRLRDGLWVQASGVVFETWADSGPGSNVTEQAEYDPEAGEVIWLIDDGYSAGSAPGTSGRDPRTNTFVEDAHPRAILFAQYTSQGFLNVFDEDYACQVLSDVHIERAKARPYPMPEYVAHGPGAAEIRGRLFAAGLSPVRCTVTVEESIKEMRGWLSPDLNGVRMLRVHPRCADFRGEMLAYAYDKDTGKPIKRFDHGPDAVRYGCWVLRYERPGKDV